MFKCKIDKKGRKWFHAIELNTNYKVQIEINEVSKDWEIDNIVEFEGNREKTSYKGHFKTFIYPKTKENLENIEIEKWLGYVESKTNYVYENGVSNLRKMNLNDEQKKRLDSAIALAKTNQAIDKINDYFYYIKKSMNEGRWYKNGEDTVIEKIKVLEENNIDTEEYKSKLSNLKNSFFEQKEEQIKIDLKRYFTVSSLSYARGDNYRIGEIIKNKDGKLGKVIKEWKYYEEDTMSFGYMCDGGYINNAKCDTELVTEQEKQEFYAKENEEKEKKEKQKELNKIKKELNINIKNLLSYIKDNGIYNKKDNEYIKVSGVNIFDDFNCYGGGSRIIIDNDLIWAISNNGADGDNWSLNNIHTGGAGAIGYFIKLDDNCNDYINSINKLRSDLNDKNRV